MRETIILAPEINETELLRTMARNGINTLGMRIMGASDFARHVLMKSAIAVTEEFTAFRDEPAVYGRALESSDYFSAASYADALQFSKAMNQLRNLILAGSHEEELDMMKEILAKGSFPEKNQAILEVYEAYHRMAGLDSAGLLRKALKEGRELDSELLYLKEAELTPLAKALLDKVSSGKAQEISLVSLFEKEEKPVKVASYLQAYGNINEVEAILGRIYGEGLALDQCVIACANPDVYGKLFYEYGLENGISMSFGTGLPITLSNPAGLLKAVMEWEGKGQNGIDALEKMVCSSFFDTPLLLETLGCHRRELMHAVEIAGNLRLSFDGKENERKLQAAQSVDDEKLQKYMGLTVKLSEELSRGFHDFVSTYANMRNGIAVDSAALPVILNAIDLYEEEEGNKEGFFDEVLKSFILRENSREGSIYITSIQGALSTVRKHVFICGMSASVFPGNPTENYLILDEDFRNAGLEMDMSAKTVSDKKKALDELVKLASSLESSISISYSGYSLAELKEENPSSSIYEIFRMERGMDQDAKALHDSFERAGYFDQNMESSYGISRGYLTGKEAPDLSESMELENKEITLYSPSTIEDFFACPRAFELGRLKGIDREEPDDPYSIINPKELGSLYHKVMEDYADGKGNTGRERFDEFLRKRPAIDKGSGENERNRFLSMVEAGFAMDPGNEVVMAEEKLTAEIAGIPIGGYPDRIEKTEDGKYIIADFKTGRRIRHMENDLGSCLQAVLYAYMAEAHGMEIDHCEYRYPRKGITVCCSYDEDRKQELTEKMEVFRDALERQEFPPIDDRMTCKYCEFNGICRKEEKDV